MFLTTYRPAGNRNSFVRRSNDQALSRLSLFDDVFSDFLAPIGTVRGADGKTLLAAQARFDVVEKADRYEAYVELPGVNKEDIEIDIEGARVRIKAEAKNAQNPDRDLKDARVIYAERHATSWSRSFELPNDVAEDRAEASYENGVLKLTLPKKDVVHAKRLQVK